MHAIHPLKSDSEGTETFAYDLFVFNSTGEW